MDPISVAILTGVVSTLVITLGRYAAKRHYLIDAVTDHVAHAMTNVREIAEYVQELFANCLIEGQTVAISAWFEMSDNDIANVLISQMANYAPELLPQILAFQEQTRKVEVLFLNLLREITLLKNRDEALSAEMVQYLKTKAYRITEEAQQVLRFDGIPISKLPKRYVDIIPPASMNWAALGIATVGEQPRRMAVAQIPPSDHTH